MTIYKLLICIALGAWPMDGPWPMISVAPHPLDKFEPLTLLSPPPPGGGGEKPDFGLVRLLCCSHWTLVGAASFVSSRRMVGSVNQ